MTTFEELEQAAQHVAEARLAAAYESLWQEEAGVYDTPELDQLSGPFCGCDACVVCEVIDAAWPYLKKLALMAEQADAPDSNSGPARDAGSTPAEGT